MTYLLPVKWVKWWQVWHQKLVPPTAFCAANAANRNNHWNALMLQFLWFGKPERVGIFAHWVGWNGKLYQYIICKENILKKKKKKTVYHILSSISHMKHWCIFRVLRCTQRLRMIFHWCLCQSTLPRRSVEAKKDFKHGYYPKKNPFQKRKKSKTDICRFLMFLNFPLIQQLGDEQKNNEKIGSPSLVRCVLTGCSVVALEKISTTWPAKCLWCSNI